MTKLVLGVAALVLLVGVAVADAQGTFPKRIALPNGFQPEGIATEYWIAQLPR